MHQEVSPTRPGEVRRDLRATVWHHEHPVSLQPRGQYPGHAKHPPGHEECKSEAPCHLVTTRLASPPSRVFLRSLRHDLASCSRPEPSRRFRAGPCPKWTAHSSAHRLRQRLLDGNVADHGQKCCQSAREPWREGELSLLLV